MNFFKFFWKELGGFLVRSLNSGYAKERLSCSQKQGIITLIPKGKKAKEYIQNWRPISLLNTTFKILSRVMANRMRFVIDKLIGHEQKGFMKGRYIGECMRTVYDIMWEVKHSQNSGKVMLLMADFQSAFDSLDHAFIQDVLNMFNFGSSFRQWVHMMFFGAESSICQNGSSTPFVNVERGCRQGDCCSPILFILCAEILMYAEANRKQKVSQQRKLNSLQDGYLGFSKFLDFDPQNFKKEFFWKKCSKIQNFQNFQKPVLYV